MGVQKPGHDHPDNAFTAATEKIAADLAYVLGLPVPPVTLWDRGDGEPAPRWVAVSAWAFEQPLTWTQAEPALNAAQKAQLVRPASAIIPFETWIDAQDRQNGGNMLVGMDGAEIRGAWIDYAFALDHGWRGNNTVVSGVTPLYPPVGGVDLEVVKAVADDIAAIDNSTVEGIINRIPSPFLPRVVADNIIRNLLSRRAAVRALWP